MTGRGSGRREKARDVVGWWAMHGKEKEKGKGKDKAKGEADGDPQKWRTLTGRCVWVPEVGMEEGGEAKRTEKKKEKKKRGRRREEMPCSRSIELEEPVVKHTLHHPSHPFPSFFPILLPYYLRYRRI